MTRKELSELYNVAESRIQKNFPKTQQYFLKNYNLILTKTGVGEKADYTVEFASGGSDRRAITMLKEEKREVIVAEQGFATLVDFNFMVFLAICTTPMTSLPMPPLLI